MKFFLRFASYFRKFIPDFTIVAYSLIQAGTNRPNGIEYPKRVLMTQCKRAIYRYPAWATLRGFFCKNKNVFFPQDVECIGKENESLCLYWVKLYDFYSYIPQKVIFYNTSQPFRSVILTVFLKPTFIFLNQQKLM